MTKKFSSFDNESSSPKSATHNPIVALYAIVWEESERGWGIRPDGVSFHRSAQEANDYVKKFQDTQPKDYVPDEYSRPSSGPKLAEVSQSLHDHVMEHGSVWLHLNSLEAYKTYDASQLKKPSTKEPEVQSSKSKFRL